MRKAFYIKKTKAGTIFDVCNGIFITILMFAMIYPFINVLVYAFNDGVDAVRGNLYLWPRTWTLANFEYVFRNDDLARGALVSVLRVVAVSYTHLRAHET